MPPRARRQPRFAEDKQDQGNPILGGYQRETGQKYDAAFISRNLKPYKAHGLPQNLKKLSGMNDNQLYNAAARAVIKKADIKKKPPAKPKPKTKPRRP